ncbi:MAG: DNA topoisomerase VI subunit B [Thermoplasmata archaeon]|nr:DNA topoisomerase VI subunit B [Thermoplasmata archaeon]
MAVSTAEKLARGQKEISIGEFFQRNKQILGFDSLTRSMITAVKEGVDNSLDACEEAGILPDIYVEIEQVSKNEFKIILEDNGPGIVKRQMANVFGRLLYGSRFHSIRQSRGQQGIGISAVVMYGQLTTGKPTYVISKTEKEEVAHWMRLILNTKKNRADVIEEDFKVWEDKEHGTRIEVFINARYIAGKQSVLEYLKGTAIVNPHAHITFKDPNGEVEEFKRVSDENPRATREIKPHPKGIELGYFINMAKASKHRRMVTFLTDEFSRVSPRVAKEILEKAGVREKQSPKTLSIQDAKSVLKAIDEVKIMAPQTDCLSPIGPTLIKKGLRNVLSGLRPKFYAPPVTRDPKVYSGHPFQVEVGMVYGGELPKDKQVEILRFANRVPLLYHQGGDVITNAISKVDWRRYGLEQRGGKGIPYGPAVILVHVASTQIPFTSESKDAIANIKVIENEVEKALRLCARKLKTHLSKSAKKAKNREKFNIVQVLLPEIAKKSASIVGKPVPKLGKTITSIMNVIWIDDSIEYDKKRHKVQVDIYNYTSTIKKMKLYTELPIDNLDMKKIDPEPDDINGDKIQWDIKRITSTDVFSIKFELKGLEEEDFSDIEVYFSDVNPSIVIGAEMLPGDWNLDDKKITAAAQSLFDYDEEKDDDGVAGQPDEEEENDVVDYDDEADLSDDDNGIDDKAEGF